MGIINRDLGASQKKVCDELILPAGIATGVTNVLQLMPYDSILKGVNMSVFGLSGAPVYSLSILRFAGGQTAIGLGLTLAPSAFGTSGPVGFSVVAPGFSLMAGDLLLLTSGVANTAVASATVSVIYQGTADIKVYQNTVA